MGCSQLAYRQDGSACQGSHHSCGPYRLEPLQSKSQRAKVGKQGWQRDDEGHKAGAHVGDGREENEIRPGHADQRRDRVILQATLVDGRQLAPQHGKGKQYRCGAGNRPGEKRQGRQVYTSGQLGKVG